MTRDPIGCANGTIHFEDVKNVTAALLNLNRKAKGMADGDLRDQIARLEAEIEELAKILEGCRKAMLLSKVAIAAGGIWILAYFIGAIRFDPVTMIGAIAVVLGGVVVYGSNSSTSKQTTTAMKAAERHRAELIDMIDLREVGLSESRLHDVRASISHE